MMSAAAAAAADQAGAVAGIISQSIRQIRHDPWRSPNSCPDVCGYIHYMRHAHIA